MLNGKILADQFRRLKFGDRFFYSHEKLGNVPGLPPTLRQNVFKRSLSAVFCDNLPVRESMRRSAHVKMPKESFKLVKENAWVSCGEILQEGSLQLNDIAKEILDETASN